ncbi:hypothetical protein TRAPUB_8647 [Trametes pubescens]|uniref:Uncharacterized protein n=1 Tax=Trametes pubescens TaxID=154538 RepID=A0A1M2W4S7_TRAPU|nr:hypothetical protein TRAPUB_8647 [Trametes pubescens]
MPSSSSYGTLRTNTRTFPLSEDISIPTRLLGFGLETIASSAQAAAARSLSPYLADGVLATGVTKAGFRGHKNVVENAVFVPRDTVPAISNLVGVKVPSSMPEELSVVFVVTACRDQ